MDWTQSYCFSCEATFHFFFSSSFLQPTHATHLQIKDTKASFLIGFLSLASFFGRLFFGHISDYRSVNRLYLIQTALLMMAVTTMCPLATSYAGLVIYSVTFGLFDGCFVTLIAIVTGDVVGFDALGPALGFLYLVFSVPLMMGSLIGGRFAGQHNFSKTCQAFVANFSYTPRPVTSQLKKLNSFLVIAVRAM